MLTLRTNLGIPVQAEAVAESPASEDVLPPRSPMRVSIDDIKHRVNAYFALSAGVLEAPTRKARYVRPRHIAMYLAREHTSRSFPEIGRLFGGRDHATIIHACRRVPELCRSNPDFAYDVAALETSLSLVPPAQPEAVAT